MKNKLLLAAIIAVLTTVSCSHGVKYSIKGSFPQDGNKIYLIETTPTSTVFLDSAKVKDGKFLFSGRAEKNAIMGVLSNEADWLFPFFNDGKPITVDFAAKSFNGSELNNKLSECDFRFYRVTHEADELKNTLTEANFEAKRSEIDAVVNRIVNVSDSVFNENRDNIIPVAFLNTVNVYIGGAKVNEYINKGGMWTQHPFAQGVKEEMLYFVVKSAENSLEKYNAAQKYVSAFPKGKYANEVNTRLSEYKVEAEKLKEKLGEIRKAFQLYSFVPAFVVGFERVKGNGVYNFTGPDEGGKGEISGSKTERLHLRHPYYVFGYKYDVLTDYNGTYWVDDDGLIHASVGETNTISNYENYGNSIFLGNSDIVQEVKNEIKKQHRDLIRNMLLYYRDESGDPYFNVKEKGKEDYSLDAVMK